MALIMKFIRNCSALLFCFLLLVSSCRSQVVELTDATFEHQTQASTGMTTGSWFIFFKAAQCPHCKRIAPEFQELSFDGELKELGIVFATVDVPSNRNTAVRFGIRGFPTLLYLQKGKMYNLPKKRTAQSWKQFLTRDIETVQGTDIPPPMGGLEQFLATLYAAWVELSDAARGKSGKEGYIIIVMVLILVVVFGGMVALCFLPATKQVPRNKRE